MVFVPQAIRVVCISWLMSMLEKTLQEQELDLFFSPLVFSDSHHREKVLVQDDNPADNHNLCR